MARPRLSLDTDQIEHLAGIGLSQAEICLTMGISQDTLSRRKADSAAIADAIKRGRALSARAVANVLFEKATIDKDLGAMIWYEKTRRGLSDRQSFEHSGPGGGAIEVRTFDYTAAAAKIAAGSGTDRDEPSEDEDP